MVQQNFIPKDKLNETCRKAFVSYGLGEARIRYHLCRMKKLHLFMEKRGYNSYTRDVGEEFSKVIQENPMMTGRAKSIHFDYITLINLVLDGLPYKARYKQRADYTMPDTDIGQLADAFMDSFQGMHYSQDTIAGYRFHLKQFCTSTTLKGKSPKEISRKDILEIMNSNTVKSRLSIIKRFLVYLFNQGVTERDLSLVLKDYRPPVREKVISLNSAVL